MTAAARARRGLRIAPSLVSGGVATIVLLATYLATAATDLTFWDSSELITAAHTLGIPHEPGTPLWVMMAHIATRMFQSAGPARAVVFLSALATALAGGIGAAMATRWIGTRGAVAAAVSAGAMSTVWANATEAEVYAVALLVCVAMLAAGEYGGRTDASDATRRRARAVIVFLAALAIPLHQSVLVALPGAVALAWRGARPSARDIAGWCALAALALSAVAILPLLSARHPVLDAGHPVTVQALLDVLQRKQFAVSPLWPRTAPLWLQLGNVLEWADWQVALGLQPQVAPAWSRTPLTVAWVWLAALGVRTLWRHDARVGRAMVLLLLGATAGVVVWLNLRLGPSYGVNLLSVDAMHEARERDYFFVLAFWTWGLCAGAGMAFIAQQFAKRAPTAAPQRVVNRVLTSLPFALALVPLIANRLVMDRSQEPVASLPRTIARHLLDAVPSNGVLYTAGDNDTFPLWYLQVVEQYRPDVTVIAVPLLGADWYRAQLARVEHLPSEPNSAAGTGVAPVLTASGLSVVRARRPIRVSVQLSADQRRQIDPTSGWLLEGMVYAPSHAVTAGTVGLVPAALVTSGDRVSPSALKPLTRGIDPTAIYMQALLLCTRVRSLADTLLVATCNGS